MTEVDAKTTTEALIRAIMDHANQHDAAGMRVFLAEHMIFVNPVTGTGDVDEMVRFHANAYAAFPDMHYAIERILCDGNVAGAECRITATHHGEFMELAATSRMLDFPAVFVGEVSASNVRH